jgi:hypothetical protein
MTKKKEIVEEKIIKPERKVVIKKQRPILKKEEPVIEIEPIIEEPIILPVKKTRVKKVIPIVEEPKVSVKKSSEKKVIVETKKPVKKVVVKKASPIIVKPIPIKKPTKKQIEKQIENEKIDTSVPQVVPKKNVGYMTESISKVKRSEDKYISLAENAKIEERKIMSDKVQRNEVVFSHYAIDNDIAYHYYRVLTK